MFAGRRARELFDALDDDGNGVLTEEEFVQVLALLN
jgi:Ca2+-binding EF-hand superfamily protein